MSSSFTDVAYPEGLMRLMEAVPQVYRRHQFFVWTQGDLQRWLPHDLLVCGFYDREARDLVFDVFNSRPLPEGAVNQLVEQPPVWVRALVATWDGVRQTPITVPLVTAAEHHPVLQSLHRAGYQELLVHGHTRPGRPDEIESFFVLARQGALMGPNQLASMDMLLPCMHSAYQRVCVTERQMLPLRSPSAAPAATGPRPSPITVREREILQWVRDGMSNQQIGVKLGISALTVKNHVQKILRKLGASNRAQAVAIAMSQDMLGATDLDERLDGHTPH
jgi:transcriptional regulator EpsA